MMVCGHHGHCYLLSHCYQCHHHYFLLSFQIFHLLNVSLFRIFIVISPTATETQSTLLHVHGSLPDQKQDFECRQIMHKMKNRQSTVFTYTVPLVVVPGPVILLHGACHLWKQRGCK